jgi:hypothetical protein
LKEFSEADVRIAARLYFDESKKARDSLLEEAGVNLDPSALSRWLRGQSDTTGISRQLAEVLCAKGYLPFYGANMVYRAVSRFFTSTDADLSDESLEAYVGHYACYQMSSWFPGMVTVSHLEIRPKASRFPFREVVEKQHTGPLENRTAIHLPNGLPLPDEKEEFAGCCFYSLSNSVVFMLQSNRSKFPKFVICTEFNHESIAMSGVLLKNTQRTGESFHISNLCLENVGSSNCVVPRIESLEKIASRNVVQHLKRSFSNQPAGR